MRERTRADFAEAVEFGPRQGWEPARETTEGSPQGETPTARRESNIFNANNGVGHRAEEVAWASGGLLQRETFLFNPKTLSPIQPCLCQAMVL